jgi:hypothetical protein
LIISYVVQTVLGSLKGLDLGNVSVYNRSSVTDDIENEIWTDKMEAKKIK